MSRGRLDSPDRVDRAMRRRTPSRRRIPPATTFQAKLLLRSPCWRASVPRLRAVRGSARRRSPPPRTPAESRSRPRRSCGLGQRLIHSIASSFDFTWRIQNPAISSLVSVNGPSMTVRLSPENRMRAPFELACSPSPASITPALTISSLNLPIAVSISSDGIAPASDSAVALTITMNRIVVSPSCSNRGLPDFKTSRDPGSTLTSNEPRPDRQTRRNTFRLAARCGRCAARREERPLTAVISVVASSVGLAALHGMERGEPEVRCACSHAGSRAAVRAP